jgi:hypothetical protein
MTMVRSGPPPNPAELLNGTVCKLDNRTGPIGVITGSALIDDAHNNASGCAFSKAVGAQSWKHGAAPDATAAREEIGPVHQCEVLNADNDVRIEYRVSKTPCWPCDVTWNFSMKNPDANQYVGIGFKELSAAYSDWDRMPTSLPDYWGMRTSEAHASDLSGGILVGYMPGNATSGGCLRHMRADDYVGQLSDIPDDGKFENVQLSSINGRTSISFKTHVHAGHTRAGVKWTGGELGSQRVMWAIGGVGGNGGCSAALGYHQGARGVPPLNFPRYGVSCLNESA